MASSYMLVVLSVVLLSVVAPFVKAADFIIGDDSGWIPDFNYTAWVEGKHFRVGDNIIFKYTEGVHNVIPVGGAAFKACNASGATNNVFSSGNDVMPLNTAGRKWYICGKGNHCERGQKLVITVSAADASPSPSAPSPSSPSASSPPPAINPPSPPTSSSWRITTDICMVAMAAAAVIAMA
ncbi:uclacyanin-3-like [Canna indica]|uniref:Uclacyanin-3-like n=1 Tax=Canna indica TaxID=4628 RepID=A0AAQ3Q131_9LILI|nr:uclacyanin-3-like [Canna indica]